MQRLVVMQCFYLTGTLLPLDVNSIQGTISAGPGPPPRPRGKDGARRGSDRGGRVGRSHHPAGGNAAAAARGEEAEEQQAAVPRLQRRVRHGRPPDRGTLNMVAELGVRVCAPDYAKAPEAWYPVARDQCLARVRVNAVDMYAMGSSSGAQVLISMLLVARREGLPLPAPLDLGGAGNSAVSNGRGRDIAPVRLLSALVAENYAPLAGGEEEGTSISGPTDPLYSPLYADYGKDAWFPRTVLTVGTREFAVSNGVRFYWRLREAGVEVELLLSEGMWHGSNWSSRCRKL
ncbi:Alpha/Beta hydrolase protein [Apiospora phragmitis]|uniref:Alpha/Beta hydrolase protein n=1 Tax=Apiospora phragmitis TaxID=2905665 RepID=A0ABR1VH89_9PEZI